MDEQTLLAHKRTELAHERTTLAYIRTAASLILFGIAFIGFEGQSRLFLYVGFTSLAFGFIFLFVAILSYRKHNKEIGNIMRLINPLYKKKK